jgi:Zn-dependent peptidase ImmA (M78 family)
VDILGMVHAFGLNAYSDKLGEGVVVKLLQDPKFPGSSGYTIYVNNQYDEKAQRFSVAHSLAHYILHKSRIPREGITDNHIGSIFMSQLGIVAEADANRLALEILIPEHLLAKYQVLGFRTPEALAPQFQVWPGLVESRLERLKP